MGHAGPKEKTIHGGTATFASLEEGIQPEENSKKQGKCPTRTDQREMHCSSALDP